MAEVELPVESGLLPALGSLWREARVVFAEEAEAVLLSNRSAAHAKQYQYAAALEDAQAACSLRPRWGKAWGRAGAAHFGLGQLTEAEAAYCEGLACEPTNAQLEQGLEEVFKRREKAAE